MPVHDWTRVDAGLFHHFHQGWISSLADSLNAGLLPPHFFALMEQFVAGPIPDVLTLRLAPSGTDAGLSGTSVLAAPPPTRLVRRDEADLYAARANRITVRHRHSDVVAAVEIVSPGNKGSRSALRAFVQKSADLLRQGVHLLVLDLFPPGPRDPQGIHKAIWDEFVEEELTLPADKPLTLAAYDAGPPRAAHVEFVGVGDPLPSMPLFLEPSRCVLTPLESSYSAAWEVFPTVLRGLLTSQG